jgi:tetratricopeptide (TPR) repeat protein
LPFSASVALASRDNFLPTDGGTGAAAPNQELPSPEATATGGESLEEILQQRMTWRQELLIDKGIAEFAAGNYQSAFSQFVLADSIAGASDKNPQRLIVLCSIAAGNYSQGALALTKLLDEDPTLFTDPSFGVDRLYEDRGLFKVHVLKLRADREHDDGDAMPWLLLVYALWLDGNPQEAAEIGQKLMENTTDPILTRITKRLVAGVSGRPIDNARDVKPVWPVGEQ